MTRHPVVSRQQWTEARKVLLEKEKENTRHRDELARQRRELPWVKVDENYQFDTPTGKVSLSSLFRGRSQLIVYHFMFGPDWAEGCPSCSYVSDHLAPTQPHLAARDVALVMVSRAPIEKIEAFKKRMGWTFPWVSSFNNRFNYDFDVTFTPEEHATGEVYYNFARQPFPPKEAPGLSVFYKTPETGEIFHTYSTYSRGLDQLIGTYTLLDLVPKGRDEADFYFDMAWVRHHDKYATGELLDQDRPYWPPAPQDAGCPHCAGAKS
jgi:predicted dithiol-disulfide oxidoreductase (DUF899 family)